MRKRKERAEFVGLTDDEAVLSIYRTKGVADRTRYDQTVMAVEEVFPQEDVFFGIYENLISEAGIDRLSAFLGVEPRYEAISTRVSWSPKSVDLDASTVCEVKEFYKQVYEFCYKRFPETRELWI